MMGGFTSRLDPVEVDSEADSSEGGTKGVTFISSNTSFKTENAEVPIDNDNGDDYLGTPSSIPISSPPPSEGISQPSTTPITLTHEQQQVLDYVRAGKNVFFSGSGGTGKTLVLQQILKFFKQKYFKNHSSYDHMGHACDCFACNVAVTAPTGIAAIPIGGSTLHRAAGIGIPQRPRDFNRMWHKPVRKKWRNLNVLIVDEISMVSAELLEYLEQTIRRVRTLNKDDLPIRPFGGLQVIFAGDFFQLQPVEDKDYHTCSNQFLNRGLAWEAPAWDRAELKTVILSRVFRQIDIAGLKILPEVCQFQGVRCSRVGFIVVQARPEDSHFVDLLNGIRTGEDKAAFEEIFRRCSRHLPTRNGIQPTVLYSKNSDADVYNNEKLNALSSRKVLVIADEELITKEGLKAVGQRDKRRQEMQLNILKDADFWKDCIASAEINLKVGAQVMLLKNLILEGNESDLVNGSRGILVGWKPKDQTLRECHERLEKCARIQRERSETDEERRVRIREEQKVYNISFSSIEEVPIVRFRNGRIIDCVPEKFSYEMLNVGECIRWQVPLKLAWAITIHKCQGMTLDYVKVTLAGIFAEGQVYVALSRARSMESLEVIGTYNPRDVRVSQKVVEFYKALAAKEVPSISKFVFPAMTFEVPPEEVQAGRRRVDGIRVDGITNEFFQEIPPGVFTETVVTCYHCKKKGHPASACKLGRHIIINA